MDLAKEYPRSVRDKWQGVVQLARTIDKGKAKALGDIGGYHYNRPMDQAIFGFLGIDQEQLLDSIRYEPQGESAKAFQGLRAQIAPDRTDVTTWPDLLDIDEKRHVPRRTASVG
ncbi:MAG TPA: DUF5069 domain-containing protein [Candidatus Cybelea sp.]|nr:DUF5069 domain-containing protein [Candidatus Cybelea sp.]